ncbi:MAG: hypothetical protein AB8G23_10110 [Myxococcota bacterium]
MNEVQTGYPQATVDSDSKSDKISGIEEATPVGAVAATLLSHDAPADGVLSSDSALSNSAESVATSHFEHASENSFETSAQLNSAAALAAGATVVGGTVLKNLPEIAAAATTPTNATQSATASATPERGRALPGDRGPREKVAEPSAPQRPSFWRRIALGRRGSQRATPPAAESNTPPSNEYRNAAQRAAHAAGDAANTAGGAAGSSYSSTSSPAPSAAALSTQPAGHSVAAAGSDLQAHPDGPAVAREMLEKQVVEPMLQALVSVEAKLERSHSDLTGRSDQVEQRLTQLWDIEEQLGTLGELQESLLQVSEQQRRLENALVAQTRSLRWLIGGVFFAITAAAFVVAAVLR